MPWFELIIADHYSLPFSFLDQISCLVLITQALAFWITLSDYSAQAFIVLGTESNRVLAKYYHSKGHPQLEGELKELLTLKKEKVFKKGLWQKTKKPRGAYAL